MRYQAYLFCCVMWLAAPATAQLNENCTVSVLNRNVQAKADGTWVLPNIPANFGRVRARATCVQGGITRYGQSDQFTIAANGSVTLPPIMLGPTTPIPSGLVVSVAPPLLTGAGATAQLQVLATYATGKQVDVTGTGTSYSISNSAIATITSTGLVTAMRSGTVVVQAINEGAQGIVQVRVALSDVDSDGDGIPDEEELRLGMAPNNPADAQLDLDHDGLTALEEYRLGTDPRNPDSDGDGISDGDEVRCALGFCTNPLLADTDGDGVRDGMEIRTGSDPTNAASVNMALALRGIRVAPDSFNLIVNSLTGSASVQLTVIGTMVDGVEIDLTSSVRQTQYASSNVNSCNFGGADGRVYAGAAGTCEITVNNNGHAATAQGKILDFSPGARSFVAIPGFANGVAVNGDFAYVAAGLAGLQVVALSGDRRTPKLLAGLHLNASANDVFLANNMAYLATSAGLVVVDVSTPATPRLRGSFAAIGNAMAVKLLGSTAYVVAKDSLYLVNVANPGAMTQAGVIQLGGTAWNLDLDPSRSLAAVAMGKAGVKLVDVSSPSAPVLRGTAFTGDARGVALRGNTAIVADYTNSMTSVDIGNLVAPTILSSTSKELGGLLNNVVLSGNFALGADIVFINGVPIVDISDPQTLLPRAILNFTDRDDNGMGIAVDDNYIYLAADRGEMQRGGVSGDSRLYIALYQPRLDISGVAPTAAITAPANGALVYEGAPLTVTVDANDDVTVADVRFLLNRQPAFTTTSGPYQYTFRVPTGISNMELGAVARDQSGNEGAAAPVTVNVAPDPLTKAIGKVIDERDGTPLAGALVTAPGGRTGITDQDGRFQINDIPTVLGDLVLQASYSPPGGLTHQGASPPTSPIPAGVTDMGQIGVLDIRFETDYGVPQTYDRCALRRTLPFIFPYYGGEGSQVWIDNFGSVKIESAAGDFIGALYAFGDGMYCGHRILINDQLPGRYIITYDRQLLFGKGGRDTVQVQLFRSGRVVFAFKDIASLRNGLLTAFSPPSPSELMSVDFSRQQAFAVPPTSAIAEFFDRSNPFDLDNGFIVFTPSAAGGYQVHTILSPPLAPATTLSGAVAATVAQAAPTRLRAAAQRQRGEPAANTFANAEVRVMSSGNPHFHGMTNTDAQGRFTLKGVPPGSINVEIWRNGMLVGRGAGLSRARPPGTESLQIELFSPGAQSID